MDKDICLQRIQIDITARTGIDFGEPLYGEQCYRCDGLFHNFRCPGYYPYGFVFRRRDDDD